MKVASTLLLCLAAALAAAGQVLLKRGADGRVNLAEFLNLQIGGGLLLYGLGTILWIAALAREPLVHAYTFTALSFVLVYGASVWILHERLTTSGGVGVALVLLGLYLIASRPA
jgi:undecaprenyl phosphate-alpha-L-ara4N flippase subunit ArnE